MAILGNKNVDITVLFNGELLEEEVIKAGMKGLRKCGEIILNKAQNNAPILTGALVRSGTVQKRGTEVEISFNTPYALRQHEEHKSKSKYLERPFNEISQKADYFVENEIANEVFKAKAKKWGYLK